MDLLLDTKIKKIKNLLKSSKEKCKKEFTTYKLLLPTKQISGKKYFAFRFEHCDNIDDWIVLKKANYIIQYSVVVKNITQPIDYSIYLAVKEEHCNKVRVILGSKTHQVLNSVNDTISNTILFKSDNVQQLCVIGFVCNNLPDIKGIVNILEV